MAGYDNGIGYQAKPVETSSKEAISDFSGYKNDGINEEQVNWWVSDDYSGLQASRIYSTIKGHQRVKTVMKIR